jgi:hypothetical protein
MLAIDIVAAAAVLIITALLVSKRLHSQSKIGLWIGHAGHVICMSALCYN